VDVGEQSVERLTLGASAQHPRRAGRTAGNHRGAMMADLVTLVELSLRRASRHWLQMEPAAV
jgi:hypothetical protein